jgi:hypothetical protein
MATAAATHAITPTTPAARTRFAIEYGPFVSAADAEQVEWRLIVAGYATVRSRQTADVTAYAVLVERVSTLHEADVVAASLRERGIGDAVVVGADPIVLRVGAPQPLRGAVALAERVRAAGHQVRIAAHAGQAPVLIVRHGAFASREAAEARRRELGQLDLPANQIVPVR